MYKFLGKFPSHFPTFFSQKKKTTIKTRTDVGEHPFLILRIEKCQGKKKVKKGHATHKSSSMIICKDLNIFEIQNRASVPILRITNMSGKLKMDETRRGLETYNIGDSETTRQISCRNKIFIVEIPRMTIQQMNRDWVFLRFATLFSPWDYEDTLSFFKLQAQVKRIRTPCTMAN